MKINKINYQKAFNIGPFLQEKIGFEADVDETEDISEAIQFLQSLAEDCHKKSNPHLYQDTNKKKGFGDLPNHEKTQVTFGPPPIIDLSHERLEIEIDNCTSEEELKKWKEEHPIIPVSVCNYFNSRREILRLEKSNKEMGNKNSRQ